MQAIETTPLPQSTGSAPIILARGKKSMARKRYQKGQLIKDGDRWLGRWREDVLLPSGQIKRMRLNGFQCYVIDSTARAAVIQADLCESLDLKLDPVKPLGESALRSSIE